MSPKMITALSKLSKQERIAFKILLMIRSGYTVEQAIDRILGNGTYQKIAGALWGRLQETK